MAEYSAELHDALMWCLHAVEVEGRTVEDCLARYADHQQALEPLLRTALRLQAAAATPTSTFRQQAVGRLQARLQQSARPPIPSSYEGTVTNQTFKLYVGQYWTFFRRWRYAMVAIITAFFVLFAAATGGVVLASDGAAPGDLLYSVDRAVEEFRLDLNFDDGAEAELELEFADERLGEADELNFEGDSENVAEALAAFDEGIASIEALLAGGSLTAEQQANIEAALAGLQAARVAAGLGSEVEVEFEIEFEDSEVEIDLDIDVDDDDDVDGEADDEDDADDDECGDDDDDDDDVNDDDDDEGDECGHDDDEEHVDDDDDEEEDDGDDDDNDEHDDDDDD